MPFKSFWMDSSELNNLVNDMTRVTPVTSIQNKEIKKQVEENDKEIQKRFDALSVDEKNLVLEIPWNKGISKWSSHANMEYQHVTCFIKKLLFGNYVWIFDGILYDDVILWIWHHICLPYHTSFISLRTSRFWYISILEPILPASRHSSRWDHCYYFLKYCHPVHDIFPSCSSAWNASETCFLKIVWMKEKRYLRCVYIWKREKSSF